MATITLKGNPIETAGDLPNVGSAAPNFTLTRTDLSDVTLMDYSGKKLVLNIFPSLDTPVCANSVRKFNEEAGKRDDTMVLCISADLPFAHGRFCEAEGIDQVDALSTMRAPNFGDDYGVGITTGPLKGLMSRAVVIIGKNGRIAYTQQVPEIVEEPDYGKALAALDAAE